MNWTKISSLLATISVFAAPLAGAEEAITLQPGLLVDANNGQAYIMEPTGGIARIDVATGNLAWRSSAAARPLMLSAGELTAQADSARPGQLALTTIDINAGKVLDQSDIDLPDAVSAQVDDGVGTRFHMRPSTDSGTLLWRYDKRLAQGAVTADAPPPVRHFGMLRTDGSSLKSVAAPDPKQFDEMWLSASRSVEIKNPATRQASAGSKTLAQQVNQRQFRSVDGEHILTSEFGPDDPVQPYRWQIADGTGQVLGEVQSPMSFSPFVVVNQVLLFVTQPATYRQANDEYVERTLTLVALSLNDGSTLWEQPLRDIRYRGPYPT